MADGFSISGKLKDKLIVAKERWAREGRHMSRDLPDGRKRLPPGQRTVTRMPVLDLGIVPNLAQREWSLSVGGAVEAPLTWSWDDLMAQPQEALVTDIHCVTTWSIYDTDWIGVSARHFLDAVKPKPTATHIMAKSYDGYSTNLSLEHFSAADVLIAHTYMGEPLPREHGGPVRLVVPQLYFWKSAKWLRHITFMEGDQPGYWEARGYHNTGDPWKQERYG